MPVPAALTLGVVAHVDAGKTSLTERLLFETGASTSLGSVDAGTTRTDSMDLERRRGITIRASVTGFALNDRTVTLVDTPGHPDFIAEVERSIGVLDAAVLVVSAVEGVQSQTVQIWRALRRVGLPTLIFVNKVDRAGADTAEVARQLGDHLTPGLIPITLVRNEGTAGATVSGLGPAEILEQLAGVDEETLESWLEGGLPDDQNQVWAQMRRASVTPVLFGSALTGAGIGPLRAALEQLPPAPDDFGSEPSATVFAIDRDPAGQRRTWLRMWSGTIAQRSRLVLSGRKPQLVTGLWVSRADGLRPSAQIRAGQVGAVVGLSGSRIGDAVGCGSPRPAQHFPPATVRALVQPVHPSRRTRAFLALQELAEEDPLINLELSEADQEAVVSLYGEVQQEVIAAVLAERFDVEVRFAEQSVLYIERVRGSGEAAELIKVDGNPYLAGLGLRVEATTENSGVTFSPGIEPGRLPPAFISATEEGVRKALLAGRFGWEVTDFRVTMTRSQYYPRQSHAHGTFSKSMSTVANDFRHLAPSVLHNALNRAGTYVCHPMDRFDLEVPESALPAVIATLGRLGAQIGGSGTRSESKGNRIVLNGVLESARVQPFSRGLADLTSGHGILTTQFERYEADRSVPSPIRKRRGPDPADRLTWFRAHPR